MESAIQVQFLQDVDWKHRNGTEQMGGSNGNRIQQETKAP